MPVKPLDEKLATLKKQAAESYCAAVFSVIQEDTFKDVRFVLKGPATLTTGSYNTGTNPIAYRKVPHVGLEEFTLQHVYVGARGDLIFRFKPAETTEYHLMEMRDEEASTLLRGFNSEVGNHEVIRAARKHSRELIDDYLSERNVARNAHVYEGGFGSW